MMHSSATMERIREVLRHAGVPKGERLEEMLDHYLSEIESQMEQNKLPQEAIGTTIQQIEQTDFSHFQQRKKINSPFAASLFFLFALLCYVYQAYFAADHFEVAATTEVLPESKEAPMTPNDRLEVSEARAPSGWPISEYKGKITSSFGMRMHPILKSHQRHLGIDIKAQTGTPVVATGPAIVKETGFEKRAGHYIILQHHGRYTSKYYHLSIIEVAQDDFVTKGEVIGRVGNTGLSTAPHLHYEIMDEGAHVDPLIFMNANL